MVRELALERPAEVNVGEEIGRAQRADLIEDLVADRTAPGQAFLGEGHTQPQGALGRHQDGTAVVEQPEGNAQPLQPPRDLGAVLELQAAIEQGVVGLGDPEHQKAEEREQADRGGAEHEETRRAERAQPIEHPKARGRCIRDGDRVRGRPCGARCFHRLMTLGQGSPTD
jgi:hypothetical protein